jgi:hypothetical protein
VRLTREQMHHLPFHWRSLWLWFKVFFSGEYTLILCVCVRVCVC